MAKTVSYDQWDGAKSSDAFWSCTTEDCSSNSFLCQCTLEPHQATNATGKDDFIKNHGKIVGNVQASQYAGKQVNYVWGFDACFGGVQGVVDSLVSGNPYQDSPGACPDVKTFSHSGSVNLGSDGIIPLAFYTNFAFSQGYTYTGNFVLQLSSTSSGGAGAGTGTTATNAAGTATSAGASASAPGASATGSNGISASGSGTSSSGGAGGTAVLPPAPGFSQSAGNGSGVGPGVGNGAGGGDSSSGTSNAPGGGNGAVIGGASAGAIVLLAVLIAIWILRGRRKRKKDEAGRISLAYGVDERFGTRADDGATTVEDGGDDGGMRFAMRSYPPEKYRGRDALNEARSPVADLEGAAASPSDRMAGSSTGRQEMVSSDDHSHPRRPTPIHRSTGETGLGSTSPASSSTHLLRRHNSVFSNTNPPAYDQNSYPNPPPMSPPSIEGSLLFLPPNASPAPPPGLPSAPTSMDQHGPYHLDDTFQVHDQLGRWAEQNRDMLPAHLESRLRRGGYVAGTDPREISAEEWLERFAVNRFELAGLVDLFERTGGMPRPSSVAGTENW